MRKKEDVFHRVLGRKRGVGFLLHAHQFTAGMGDHSVGLFIRGYKQFVNTEGISEITALINIAADRNLTFVLEQYPKGVVDTARIQNLSNEDVQRITKAMIRQGYMLKKAW